MRFFIISTVGVVTEPLFSLKQIKCLLKKWAPLKKMESTGRSAQSSLVVSSSALDHCDFIPYFHPAPSPTHTHSHTHPWPWNKDECVASIDIVANESFNSVSLTSLLTGHCVRLHVLLWEGCILVCPLCCRLSVPAILLLLSTSKPRRMPSFYQNVSCGSSSQCEQAFPQQSEETLTGEKMCCTDAAWFRLDWYSCVNVIYS